MGDPEARGHAGLLGHQGQGVLQATDAVHQLVLHRLLAGPDAAAGDLQDGVLGQLARSADMADEPVVDLVHQPLHRRLLVLGPRPLQGGHCRALVQGHQFLLEAGAAHQRAQAGLQAEHTDGSGDRACFRQDRPPQAADVVTPRRSDITHGDRHRLLPGKLLESQQDRFAGGG